MSETQPDMLGGKSVPGARLGRIRKTGKPPVARTGWADRPGSGPDGETCGSCTYCEAFHYRKRYYKCAARDGDHWKGGRATDIRPLDPACSKWAPSVNRANQPKASQNEIDSISHGVAGSPDPCRVETTGAVKPRCDDNATSRSAIASRGEAQRAASRREYLERNLAQEGLQRVFEF